MPKPRILDGWRTFSLKSLMVAVTCIAIWLAMPGSMADYLLSCVWYLVPGVLLTLAIYGNRRQRHFCTGALATFCFRAYHTDGAYDVPDAALRTFLLAGVAGVISRYFVGWLSDPSDAAALPATAAPQPASGRVPTPPPPIWEPTGDAPERQ